MSTIERPDRRPEGVGTRRDWVPMTAERAEMLVEWMMNSEAMEGKEPLLMDRLTEASELAQADPALFLSEVASFVGAVMLSVNADLRELCLDEIVSHGFHLRDNVLLRESMLTIVPWVRAEVAQVAAFEMERGREG